MKGIIIDDEQDCCEVLQTLIARYCPMVTITHVCTSAAEGLVALKNDPPDLLFLDVQMPYLNGFELLEQVLPINYSVIFTTSFDQYALKAIRYSALDYLLKPVDKDELQTAVNKALLKSVTAPLQWEILMQRMGKPGNTINRIALPTMEGLHILAPDTIISCHSSSNYTILTLKEGKKLTVSRTLKEIEEMLEGNGFLRVHHSYLVNLNEIRKYVKGEGGTLVMSDGGSIDVSRSRKEALLKELGARR